MAMKKIVLEMEGNRYNFVPEGEEGDKEFTLQEMAWHLENALLALKFQMAQNSRILRPGAKGIAH